MGLDDFPSPWARRKSRHPKRLGEVSPIFREVIDVGKQDRKTSKDNRP